MNNDEFAGKQFTLSPVGFRPPRPGELYIDKKGDVQRCKELRVSKHAQKRVVVIESGWRGGWPMAIDEKEV